MKAAQMLMAVTLLAAVAVVVSAGALLWDSFEAPQISGKIKDYSHRFSRNQRVSVFYCETTVDHPSGLSSPAISMQSDTAGVVFEFVTPDISRSFFPRFDAPADVYFTALTPKHDRKTLVAEMDGTAANNLVDHIRHFRDSAIGAEFVLAGVVSNASRPPTDVSDQPLEPREAEADDEYLTSDVVVGTSLNGHDFCHSVLERLSGDGSLVNADLLFRDVILIRGTEVRPAGKGEFDAWFSSLASPVSPPFIDGRRVKTAVDTVLVPFVSSSGDAMMWRCSDGMGGAARFKVTDPSVDLVRVRMFARP